MKKRLLAYALLFGIFCLTGCSNKMLNLASSNIAEVRYNIYSGNTNEISATFMSGLREKDYIVNGYATKLTPFGILTFNLHNVQIDNTDTATYLLKHGTTRYEGELEVNPFDGTYVADIKKLIDDSSSLNVQIVVGTFTQELILHKVNSDWKVNHDEALKIATKYCKSELKNYEENNYFLGEVYIKIIEDTNTLNEYLWYVSFLNRNGTNTAVLINPHTGDIIQSAKK